MNTMATSGFGNGALDSLAIATDHGRTRCVNAENPTGGKGTAATAASALGPSRKGSPCIQTIKAGDSVTLMDVDGPGVIRHIWMTVTDRTSPTGPNVLRNLILEFYWDGEETPSVQCPIGDFFCCGHAQACRINSIPIMVVPNRGFNCYFAMPFEHARIVLRNDHNEDVPAFFYQIDYTEYDALPADAMRFHAQWRRERVTEIARDYTILDNVHGHGAYIGTYLALTALESRWWGEGEASPTSTSMAACARTRSPDRTWDSRSIRSVLPRTAKATTGMWPHPSCAACTAGTFRIRFISILTCASPGSRSAPRKPAISSGRMTSRRWHTGTSLNRTRRSIQSVTVTSVSPADLRLFR